MRNLDETEVEYEIMKIGIVISEYIPDADFEDIYKKAKEILKQWDKDFENLPLYVSTKLNIYRDRSVQYENF